MKKLLSLTAAAAIAALGFAACNGDDTTTPEATETYVATLLQNNEVPPTGSPATGTVVLTINPNQTVSWTMDLAGIKNMTMSHIHGPGAPGVNAPVRANLYIPTATVTTTLTGTVATGTFGPSNVAGITYDSLLVLIRNGNSYVNVHTNDGVAPTNSGPGDFPGGEIRGLPVRQQ
jgi:hypothetical protein